MSWMPCTTHTKSKSVSMWFIAIGKNPRLSIEGLVVLGVAGRAEWTTDRGGNCGEQLWFWTDSYLNGGQSSA